MNEELEKFESVEEKALKAKNNILPEGSAEEQEYRDIIFTVRERGKKNIRKLAKQAEQNYKQIQTEKSNAKHKIMTNNNSPSKSRLLPVAASIAILACAGYFLFMNKSSEESGSSIDKAYAQYYKADDKKVFDILDRMEAQGFASTSGEGEDTLTQALKYYGNFKFDEAKSTLSQYLNAYPENETAKMYMGLTQLQLGNYAPAIEHLTPLYQNTSYENHEMVKWYLAMCYIRVNDKESIQKAKQMLRELSMNKSSEYHKEATGFLSVLG